MLTRLSLLIPTVFGREHLYDDLVNQINALGEGYPFEIVTLKDERGASTIGEKRNELRRMAKGDYIAFIDDDDLIGPTYFKNAFQAIEEGKDCMGLIGLMTTDGGHPKTFEHSIIYDHYFQQNGIYCRPPNHLNPMRKDIAMEFDFPHKSMGEDTDWAMMLCNSKLIQSEHFVMDVVYTYRYVRNKKY